MQEIIAKNYTTIPLGQQGENLARCVCFEIGDWRTSYGEGRAELLVMRAGDTAPYPATIAQSGNTVRWELTAADTAKDGLGAVELRYYVGDALVKSHTKLTQVYPALGEASATPPDPWQSWVTQVLVASQAAQNAVAHPPTIGDNGNWYLWDGEQMVDSGVSAHGIAGADGQAGTAGANGKSAYDTATDAGYDGTEAEFSVSLASLHYAILCTAQTLSEAQKTTVWVNTNSIKTTMDSIVVAGAQYYLGEQSALTLTLPATALIGQQISVVFYSGDVPATLAIVGNTIGELVVPMANQRVEVNILWDGTKWAILSHVTEALI